VAHAIAVMVRAVGGLSVAATVLSVEMAMLSALDQLVGAVCETEGSARWPAASLVTNGMWLIPVSSAGPTTSRVFSDGAERRLMAVIDPNMGERPP
jgi:hypothetical protein